MRFFLPTHCTHGPGEDPFEAVMCAVGAASQISCCLLKSTFSTNTKYHLESLQDYYNQSYYKSATLFKILYTFQKVKHYT